MPSFRELLPKTIFNIVVQKSHREIQERSYRALRKTHSEHLMKQFDDIINNGRFNIPATAAGRDVRNKVALLASEEFYELKKKNKKKKYYYHITLINKHWDSGDLDTYLNVRGAKKQARDALNYLDIDYLAWAEIQAFSNCKFSDGQRRISLHFHAVAWSYERLSCTAMECKIENRFDPVFNGLKCAKIKIVRDTDKDLCNVAMYPLKSPSEQKNYYKHPTDPSKNCINASQKAARKVVSLRLVEIMSLMDISKLVFASGEGTQLRNNILKKLGIWQKSSSNYFIERSHNSARLLWKRLRKTEGHERFKPPIIKI